MPMYPPKKLGLETSGLETEGLVEIQNLEFSHGASLRVVAPQGTKIVGKRVICDLKEAIFCVIDVCLFHE